MFRKRAGCTDRGKDYEHLYICNLLLQLITDNTIKNFQLSSNDDNFGAFDDVVLEIEHTNGGKEILAIQLKQVNKKKTLTKSGLAEKNGNFSIQKYFEYSKNIEVNKLILFTNLKFEVTREEPIVLTGDDFNIKTKVSQEKTLLSTSETGRCYQFESPCKKYKDFFKKFFLYTNQASVEKLRIDTMNKFLQMFNSDEDVFEQYVHFITRWSLIEGTKDKLNKNVIISAIVVRLLTPYVVPLKFSNNEEVSTNTQIFREAMSKFQIVHFDRSHSEKVRVIWKDAKHKLDTKNLNEINRKYQVTSNYISNINELSDKDCTKLLWLMGLSPLPVFANKIFEKIVSLCEHPIILFGATTSISKVFRKLSDLDTETSRNITKHFKCSLQGKDDLTLEALIKKNSRKTGTRINRNRGMEEEEGKIRSIITTDELVQMLDEPLKIDKKEILPIPHIDRILTRNIISMDFLSKARTDTLIIISNVKEGDEQKIKNSSITNINLTRVEDFWKKKFDTSENRKNFTKIFFSENECSQSEVEGIYKNIKNVSKYHQFRMFEGELEWVRSQGDVLEMKEFLTSGKCIEQSKLFSVPPDNRINIVCADPGMGKSILMKNLKNSSKLFTIFVQPKDHSKYFREKNTNSDDFIKYIVDKTYKNCSSFVVNLINILIEDRQVMFIWDGLDEAAKENFIIILEIIDQLRDQGYYQWLTSRCNLMKVLEYKFSILSRAIDQFDSEQQNNYIEKRLNCTGSDLDDIKNKIYNCIKLVQYNDILGIPLQIYMFTELFRQNPDKYRNLLSSIFSITDLYRYFVDEKFNIYHQVKANIGDSNDMIMQIVERSKNERLRQYEEAALKTYLKSEIVEALRINCDAFLESIQVNCDSVGIIVDVTDEKIPNFLHNSYGEYFVASFLQKYYKTVPNFRDFIFEERYNNVRFLFDLLMAEERPAHIAVLYKNLEVLEGHEGQVQCKDQGGRSPLHLACSWGKRFDLKRTDLKETEMQEAAAEDTPEYQKIVTYLSTRCDPFETDGIFHVDCFHYADVSCCLLPILTISNQHKIDFKILKNFNDIDRVLYNAVKFDYSDVFEDIPFMTIDNGESLLYSSVRHGSINCLKKILINEEYKECLNDTDTSGVTAFHLACRNGSLDIITCLMDAGADINTFTKDGYSAIYIAARADQLHVIHKLLASGVDINARNKEGHTAFYLACYSGDHKVAQALINLGANVDMGDNFDYTPLYMACRRKNEEIIKLLLENGADVNAPNNHGDVPLFMAAWSCQLDVVKRLLELGADVNCVNRRGHGAIHAACLNGFVDVLHVLIEAGANINKANKYGQTPLHLALRHRFDDGIILLLGQGADDGLVNKQGQSFWELGSRCCKPFELERIVVRAKGRAYWKRCKDRCTFQPKKVTPKTECNLL